MCEVIETEWRKCGHRFCTLRIGDRLYSGTNADLLSIGPLGTSFMKISTLRPTQNCRQFAGDIFKCIFLNENLWISLKVSLKFVPRVGINNIPALVLIMAWCRPGAKAVSEPLMASLLTNICVTRPQWVKSKCSNYIEESELRNAVGKWWSFIFRPRCGTNAD